MRQAESQCVRFRFHRNSAIQKINASSGFLRNFFKFLLILTWSWVVIEDNPSVVMTVLEQQTIYFSQITSHIDFESI